MAPDRYLIVNADDFGLCEGVNRGIIEAHTHGIVTSASLMVRYPAAVDAVNLAKDSLSLSLGLHVDLCEWLFTENHWIPLYEVVPSNDAAAIRQEILRQLQSFVQLTGRNPTHLDSHQRVHRQEPVRSIVQEIGRRLGIPVRGQSNHITYIGAFYGQNAEGAPYPEAIAPESMIALIHSLPDGVSEITCHPGFLEGMKSVYRDERVREVVALCDPEVEEVLSRDHVRLCSYKDLFDGDHGASATNASA